VPLEGVEIGEAIRGQRFAPSGQQAALGCDLTRGPRG
jgi:hypothetical protein